MAYKVKKDPIDKIPKAQFVFWCRRDKWDSSA